MNRIHPTLTALLLGTLSIAALPQSPAQARPYPDRLGICYRFQAEDLRQTMPCVVSSGYGAGGHYAVLHWSNGQQNKIFHTTSVCDKSLKSAEGQCPDTVDGAIAELYERDNAFLREVNSTDQDNVTCYKTLKTGDSVCYRVP